VRKLINPALLKKVGMVVAGIALLVLVALVFMRSGPLAPVQVVVTTVKEGRIQPGIFGVGTVEARRSWMVGPTTAGRVLNVTADVGDQVKAGELLAEMDAVDIDQRLEASQATVARASSALNAAHAQLADANARRDLASINAKRNQDLATQNFISAGALEARLQEKTSADAGYQVALANLEAARQDLTRTKAERDALGKQRANVRLMAPNSGVVVSREAEPGSTVVAGQAVLRMIDPNSLWVKMRVDQGRSAGLTPGLNAKITLRSQPEMLLSGKVARVEMQADSVTEERIAQIAFESGSDALRKTSLGELAEVTLELPQPAPALIVPNAAIQRTQGKVGVWRIQDHKLEYVPVRLGASDLDGQVQVIEGLKSGDSVVVYSQKALKDDTRIKVVEALVQNTERSTSP
jgi:HlyD family secretion protein